MKFTIDVYRFLICFSGNQNDAEDLTQEVTTITIDGSEYARIVLVVSKTSNNYEVNKAFAYRIHEKLEQRYPGLSRGVSEKGENPQNTYNQDVLDHSVLLNIGGVENTLEESFRTTDALAKVLKEMIQELEE